MCTTNANVRLFKSITLPISSFIFINNLLITQILKFKKLNLPKVYKFVSGNCTLNNLKQRMGEQKEVYKAERTKVENLLTAAEHQLKRHEMEWKKREILEKRRHNAKVYTSIT